jgi:hypothetical protein
MKFKKYTYSRLYIALPSEAQSQPKSNMTRFSADVTYHISSGSVTFCSENIQAVWHIRAINEIKVCSS